MKLRSLLARLPIERFRNPPPLVAVVTLGGVIGGVGPLRRGLTLAGLGRMLERAFTLDGVDAVALAINSPGGSAVQSALIHKRIRALADEHGVPVVAFVEDVAASGGYWLALAADEIHADDSSIVGSIGVVASGFGLDKAIERFGIERRLYTAGERKAMLDPFRPEDPADVAHLTELQGDIHEAFKDLVRERRGARLKGDEETLFSGAFWTGRRALEHGLIDGIGELRGIMRARFGEAVRFKMVGEPRRWWRPRLGRLASAEASASADWATGVLGAIEDRLWWSRYGL
jgi:signal peptide peptidase SppA